MNQRNAGVAKPKGFPARDRKLSRRSLLQAGVLGITGLGLPDLLRAKAIAASAGKPSSRDLSVILVWLDGGPPQHETYDPKPDAPDEFRGPLKAARTNVPGTFISELLPAHGRIMDKVSLIRSMHHSIDTNFGDHFTAEHVTLTGYNGVGDFRRPARNPSYASVIAKLKGAKRPGVPPYVGLPTTHTHELYPGYHGASYLGGAYGPFIADGDPNSASYRAPQLTLTDGLSLARLDNRRGLLADFERTRRDLEQVENLDPLRRGAFNLLTNSKTQTAFEIFREDPKLRDRYGRHEWGQAALLSRRLVEAGVRFVTLTLSRRPIEWDLHGGLEPSLRKILPELDSAVAALVTDLDDRGLLDSTLVMVMGEFGRAPRVTMPAGWHSPGRDHWVALMSVLVAGGGCPRGRVIGSSNAKGAEPRERPVSPQDLMVTVYHKLGIDPETAFLDRTGRPVAIGANGEVIEELC